MNGLAFETERRHPAASAVPGRIDGVAHTLVSIGDFSRMTHLTVKALRYYHEVGVLEPRSIDPDSGYRRYATDQVPIAQVVKRLRALDMPIDEVREVVTTPGVDARNSAIAAHLRRMEEQLAATSAAVASLRSLLDPAVSSPVAVSFHTGAQQAALAIDEELNMADVGGWLVEALTELLAEADQVGARRAGAPGTLFFPELFERGRGRLVAFVPVRERSEADIRSERAHWFELPAGDTAVMMHEGAHRDMDMTYGALGSWVAERAIGVAGPIREDFVISQLDTEREQDFRTEISWPVFRAT